MDKDFIFKYKGVNYTQKKLEQILDKQRELTQTLKEYDLFICEECGEIVPYEDLCREHYDMEYSTVCKECCEECRHEFCEADWYESKLEEARDDNC